MAQQPRKQHLLDVAHQLFNKHGYHATGIDWILAELGVSKATLYKYFRSKEALILAVLQQRHEHFVESIKVQISSAKKKEEHPVLAIFNALEH